MSDSASLKVQAEKAQNGKFKGFLLFLRDWFFRNKLYFIAFMIPVVIMYAAYVIFEIYPFGDKSVLVLDLNGQYVYYFQALRDAFWKGDVSALYNWSRNLSGGFAGVIGYYLASPFTLIVMLLPSSMLLGSLLILQLVKLGSAAVTFCYYLRKSKGLTQPQSLVLAALYSLCAYAVIQLIDPMWLDGLVLLPLIILGVEYLVDDGRKLNCIIPLAVMMIANFYIGYMICIFTALYFFFYLFFGCKNAGRKNSLYDMWNALVRMGISAAVALACAAFMILPVYNALKLGKFDFTEPDFSYASQFKPQDFFPQLMVAQYDSVNVQGLPEIYCGIFTLVLAPLFFMNKEIKILRKTGYGLLLAILFTCMYIRPVDMVWHGFQMPNWLPFRYSFTFSFVLLCMAAETLKNIKGIKLGAICGTFLGIAAFFLVTESRDAETIAHIETKDIWITIALSAVYCLIVFVCTKKERLAAVAAPVLVLAVSGGELLYNCVATLHDEDKEIVYSNRSTWYNFIENGREVTNLLYEQDPSFYRSEKTFQRMVNDNCALGIRGLSHSSSVMNARTLKFIKAMGHYSSIFESKYSGATPVSDSLLGMKYVMDRNPVSDLEKMEEMEKSGEFVGAEYIRTKKADSSYTPVFSYEYKDENDIENRIDVYENPNALSIGFMSDETIRNIERFGPDNVFNSQNIFLSTVSGNTVIENGAFSQFNEYFKRIDVSESLVLNNVTSSPYDEYNTMYIPGEGDPTVDMSFTVQNNNPIYAYIREDYTKDVNLWLSNERNQDGAFDNFRMVESYYKGDHVIELGRFEPGTEVNLRMTVIEDCAIISDFFIYELDEALYNQTMEQLKKQQWNLTEAEGNYFKGTIDAVSGQIMLTSIPYEPGWTVKVDGKKVEYIEIAEALIGIPMEAGEHTVEMKYFPPGMKTGFVLLFFGAAAMVLIYLYDRKNNKVIIAARRDKNPQTESAAKKGRINSKKKK